MEAATRKDARTNGQRRSTDSSKAESQRSTELGLSYRRSMPGFALGFGSKLCTQLFGLAALFSCVLCSACRGRLCRRLRRFSRDIKKLFCRLQVTGGP